MLQNKWIGLLLLAVAFVLPQGNEGLATRNTTDSNNGDMLRTHIPEVAAIPHFSNGDIKATTESDSNNGARIASASPSATDSNNG